MSPISKRVDLATQRAVQSAVCGEAQKAKALPRHSFARGSVPVFALYFISLYRCPSQCYSRQVVLRIRDGCVLQVMALEGKKKNPIASKYHVKYARPTTWQGELGALTSLLIWSLVHACSILKTAVRLDQNPSRKKHRANDRSDAVTPQSAIMKIAQKIRLPNSYAASFVSQSSQGVMAEDGSAAAVLEP